jgi:hypothetical protein
MLERDISFTFPMNPIRYPLLPLTVIAFLFFSCQRQLENYLPVDLAHQLRTAPPASTDKDITIYSGIEGRVLDENNQPLADAVVTAGGVKTTTNSFGIFSIKNVSVSEQWSFITVQKPGYFSGSRTVVSRSGANSFVAIKLLQKQLSGTFGAGQSASVKIGSLATIAFQPNAMVTDDGAQYEGKVFVYGALISPVATDLDLIMPGDLRGVNAAGRNVALRTYGMLGVNLETETGQHLQLADGKPAQVTMTMPEAMAANTPDEVPLWHFDESDGKWKEEGKAVKKGNALCGTTSHFSFWNFDVPGDFVYISLQLRGPKASPVSYTAIKIVDKRNNSYSSVYTDSTGYLRTWVPKNVPIEINVLNGCGEVIHSENAGPFIKDEEIGGIMIQTETMTAVGGKVTDCEGKLVKTGVVSLYSEGLYYSADIIDGEFSVLVNDCNKDDNTAELYATDGTTKRKSNRVNIRLDSRNIHIGQLTACEIHASGADRMR